MWTWMSGQAKLAVAEQRDVAMADILPSLAKRQPMRAKGTAVFLTTDPEVAPAAFLHNLKHNQVLHEQVVLLTIKVLRRPRVPDAERVEVTPIAPGFLAITMNFGFMEQPDVTRGLTLARAKGLKFDIMKTSFFLSRRTLIPRAGGGVPHLRDLLFIFLMRNAVRAADFFHLPPSRVVELGAQVTF
jgi:KUP system potassium uptake protein